jgi:hypothetical protein
LARSKRLLLRHLWSLSKSKNVAGASTLVLRSVLGRR